MLGISDDDTRVWDGTQYVQTNAFDLARVGGTNGNGTAGSGFFSLPVKSKQVETGIANSLNDLWNCQVYVQTSSPPPCPPGFAAPRDPAVPIWDGSSGKDPAFVGEYIESAFSGSNPQVADYRDWRILPGSPLVDMSVVPPAGGPREYRAWSHTETLYGYPLAVVPEVDLLAWDGEHWGNPRVVFGLPDIGFDERHLLICAGHWSNDSNSHNQPGFMHPGIVAGSRERYFILPDNAGGHALNVANRQLTIYQTMPRLHLSTGNGWIHPPLALTTGQRPGLPGYFRPSTSRSRRRCRGVRSRWLPELRVHTPPFRTAEPDTLVPPRDAHR